MYTIKVDSNVMYYSANPMRDITSAKVSLQVNSSNSLEYTVIKGTRAYDMPKMLKSKVEVFSDNTRIFLGRPITESVDFNTFKTVKCEGVLGYLYDSVQRPHDFMQDDTYLGKTTDTARIEYIFDYLLTVHNQQVEDYKQITPGRVTVTDTSEDKTYTRDPDDPTYIYAYDDSSSPSLKTSYESTFDALSNLLINNLAGYLHIREEGGVMFLDYLKEFQDTDGQVISFGENLLDYSSSMDYSSICTGIIPLGSSNSSDDSSQGGDTSTDIYQRDSEGRLTIKDVNNGSDILWNQNAVDHFGKIVKSKEWSSVTDPTLLMQKAYNYIVDKQYKNLNIECKVVDLHFVRPHTTPLRFEHLVRVISPPHNLDRMMPITAMDIDLMNPANDSVTLGKTYNSASQIMQQSTK